MFSHFRAGCLILLTLLVIVPLTVSVELTFELPDSAKECFFEVIEKGTQATVEFQVGSLDLHS